MGSQLIATSIMCWGMRLGLSPSVSRQLGELFLVLVLAGVPMDEACALVASSVEA